MTATRVIPALLAAGLMAAATEAGAVVHYGNVAPDFLKTQYNASPPASLSLATGALKVRVYFLFGYNCPFCLNDGPSFETSINQYYRTTRPGAVQCLGFDMYNGTPAQVGSFQAQTAASYPLGLQGASATGGNLSTLYGPFDNYVIVDKLGVVRYHAADRWPHGNRYHPDEIRAVVDSLLAAQSGTPETPPAPPGDLVLDVSPNPFTSAARIELRSAGSASELVRVDVVDALGRLVSPLYLGPVGPNGLELRWNGDGPSGYRAPSGLYFVRVETGGRTLVRRIVRAR